MNNVNYYIYNSVGKIISIGNMPEDSISLNLKEGENYGLGVVDINLNYIENDKVVTMPTKPDGEYVFNYTTKQWEFDRATAEQKAIIKRDKLLAEGPDRISPLWWNAMTPQQQQEWEYYRQALLDITGQADYPEFIVWPIKP